MRMSPGVHTLLAAGNDQRAVKDLQEKSHSSSREKMAVTERETAGSGKERIGVRSVG